MSKQNRIVLVVDWITTVGGAEKVVEQLHILYPHAPIYTSYCTDAWRERLDNMVITGYLQHWPFAALRRFLPVLRQWWFAHIDVSTYDIVISVTGNGEAKFINTHAQQTHICYCHTPPHFYWAQYDAYLKHPSMKPHWLARLGLKSLARPLRQRDYTAAQAVDVFIANSHPIQQDIHTYYNRDSVVVHPPVDPTAFKQTTVSRHTLHTIPRTPQCIWWGRVVPAKRLDIAIIACNRLKIPFTIIGSGPDIKRLQRLAGPTITFTGFINDQERAQHTQYADLFLFPSKEDFGVAPVEALTAGIPVIAYRAGGALDYIVDRTNGLFFDTPTSDSLAHTIATACTMQFDTQTIISSATQFAPDTFRKNIHAIVNQHNTPTL